MDPRSPAFPACPPYVSFASPQLLRPQWDISVWESRIAITFILFAELFFLLFAQRRRKLVPHGHSIFYMNLRLLYLLVDLLATFSLGRLSSDRSYLYGGLWASIVIFCLGGPDTFTIFYLDENDSLLRHFLSFFTQGLASASAVYAAWDHSQLSLLTVLMLFSGLINYGKRLWAIWSSVMTGNRGHSLRLDESVFASARGSDTVLVLQAYFYFQTFKPHKSSNVYEMSEVSNLVQNFHEWIRKEDCTVQDTFKLIETELGFTYDMLFTKINTIFSVWGFIFRFISFFCVVTALMWFLLLKTSDVFTIIMLVGAFFLEIGGVLVQISSDWAIIWAYKHRVVKLLTPIFRLHRLVNSKSKRWSELIGQFNLLDICVSEYKLTIFQKIENFLFGIEKILDKKFSLPPCPVELHLKKLIFNHLREIVQQHFSQVKIPASTLKRGMGSLEKNQCMEEFKWSIELEFSESITIWHIATNICYHSREGKSDDDELIEETKKLSSYMMHLLHICPLRFHICDNYDDFILASHDLKKFFREIEFKAPKGEAWKELVREQNVDPEPAAGDTTIAKIQRLSKGLLAREDKWKIMSNVWVEMLCYAASNCPVTDHAKQLNNGGELLTHVWLLLLHLGLRKKVEEFEPSPN